MKRGDESVETQPVQTETQSSYQRTSLRDQIDAEEGVGDEGWATTNITGLMDHPGLPRSSVGQAFEKYFPIKPKFDPNRAKNVQK